MVIRMMRINAIAAFVGLAGTIALSKTMSFTVEETAYTNSLVSFLFVVFAGIILRYVYARISLKDKRGIALTGVYCAILSFALTAGKQLHTVENFDAGNVTLWIQILVLTIFFWGPVLYLFQFLAQRIKIGDTERIEKKKTLRSFLVVWLVIFLFWIPVFLAFYPGAFVYDAQDEYVQVATREFSTHHPLLHVLLLGGSVCFGNKVLGSYNAGIALYTLFQMLVLSGVFAYTVIWLRSYFSKKICIGITVFYGLFPVIPMYAVCSSKDTLFHAAFLLMLIQMVKIMEHTVILPKDCQVKTNGQEDKKCRKGKGTADIIIFILASVYMMLFRHNGVIAYAVLLAGVVIVALLKIKKNCLYMRLALLMMISFVLYGSADKILTYALQADDSEKQEVLTVPIQQIARTYAYSSEVFSQEDKELLFSYIPEDVLAVYDADLSDLVKANFNNQKYTENPSKFWDLWMRTFLKKPLTYLNAWFMTSYGYWYPDTVINVYGGQQRFTFQYEDSSYFGFETELPGERDSKFPWLEEQYRRMSLELYQQKIPGISMLFSPGFLFWVFFGCLMFCLYQKQKVWILPMTAVFLLWATVLPGPTFLVRYVLILWFALPLMMASVLGKCRIIE